MFCEYLREQKKDCGEAYWGREQRVNIFGTRKAFGFAALVWRVGKRARRRGVVWIQGRKASGHPGETHSPSQKAHTAGNAVKMRGSGDEETDAGRPCWGRDVDGGLGQARDAKGPKDAAVTTASHTSFSETKEPDHSQDSSLSEDETK